MTNLTRDFSTGLKPEPAVFSGSRSIALSFATLFGPCSESSQCQQLQLQGKFGDIHWTQKAG